MKKYLPLFSALGLWVLTPLAVFAASPPRLSVQQVTELADKAAQRAGNDPADYTHGEPKYKHVEIARIK